MGVSQTGNIQLVPKRLLITLIAIAAVACLAVPAIAAPLMTSVPAVQPRTALGAPVTFTTGQAATAVSGTTANVPGSLLTPPPVVSSVDSAGLIHPSDHVFRVYLRPGQQVNLTLYGPAGSDFAIDVWGPNCGDIFSPTVNPVASSDQWSYPRTVHYVTPNPGKSGWFYFDVYAIWGRGPFTLTFTMPDIEVKTPVARIQGTDRYQTAIKASASTFATSAAVIIATGESYADALAASGLAGSYGAPILLTRHDHIAPGLLAEIHRLGATRAIMVGGNAALGDVIRSGLAGAGLTVERIAGTNRFYTAALIADRIRAHETSVGRTPTTSAFVVNGLGFADSLAVAPYAFSARMPVLLVGRDYVPTPTASAVTSLGIDSAYVVGGTAAVSGATYGALAPPNKVRIAGTTRYGTAAAMAKKAVDSGWATNSFVGVASGISFPDALAAGPATGKRRGVLLTTGPLSLAPEPRALMTAARPGISQVRVFGGIGVLFGPVFADLDSVLR